MEFSLGWIMLIASILGAVFFAVMLIVVRRSLHKNEQHLLWEIENDYRRK